MASQSDSSVSVELGALLELLNALEAQDSRPLENFATLERLLAAGKGGSAESSSEDHQPDDHQRDAHPSLTIINLMIINATIIHPKSGSATASQTQWSSRPAKR